LLKNNNNNIIIIIINIHEVTHTHKCDTLNMRKNGVSRKYVFKHIRMQMQIQRRNRIVFIKLKLGILLVLNPFYSLIDHTNILQD